ncbi:MAG: amidohydrolase family protein [Bryobacteraceae bacterium]|nr:amidohydrolase family protein [Bryobacteraceae bacterium]
MRRFCLSFLLSAFLWCEAAERADYILTANWVVTMDSQMRVIGDGAVAVRGERIAGVGTRAEIGKRFITKNYIESTSSILAPGLINTHTHAPMALFRGIADDLALQDWLERFIFPAEAKNVSPEFVRDGTRLACLEMLLSGTTTYTDMYYFEETIAEATKECGMRGVLGQTVIGFPVADAKTPAESLSRTEAFFRKYANDPLITPAVAPHALYTNDEKTLRAARALADQYRKPLLIHLSETRKENDDMQAKYGASPTVVLDRWGILTGWTVAAHAVWINPGDIAILKDRKTGIAHCPSSNMKLASGIAPVTSLLEQDMPVGLGPDGPAGSNNDFNLFEEMDLAAKLQKVHTGNPTAVSARQAFEMATIRGAHALGLQQQIGSLEEGKRADLILVGTHAPHAVPMFDVYSHLVYALKGSDVRHVMVNGRLVVRNRQILTLNATAVVAKAVEWQKKIEKSLESSR